MSPIDSAPVYDAARVAALLGIEYSAKQFAAFGPPPDPLEGFITFFDPGWSILRLREAVAGKGSTIFFPQSWYDTEPFAQLEDKARYRQVLSEPLSASFRKTFAEQQTLLANDEEVPLARVVGVGVVAHFLATGRRLFADCYVRTGDRFSDGYRVLVGYFDRDGLDVYDACWGGSRHDNVWLAVSRKAS